MVALATTVPHRPDHRRRLLAVLAAILAVALAAGGWWARPAEAGDGLAAATPGITVARDLGQVEALGPTVCAFGTDCQSIRVRCPGLPSTTAQVAVLPAIDRTRGVLTLFSGAEGRAFWSSPGQLDTESMLQTVRQRGIEVVQIAWADPGWAAGDFGFAALACRPASVVDWVHATRYVPLGLERPTGVCGFCIGGQSGGASQAAYALSHYGLSDVVDAAILTSGPPHALIARGCLAGPQSSLRYAGQSNLIDVAYGGTPGPCAAADNAFRDRWSADSIVAGAVDLTYPTTRVHVMVGTEDITAADAHAADYADALTGSGTPAVTFDVFRGGTHRLTDLADARRAWVTSVLFTG